MTNILLFIFLNFCSCTRPNLPNKNAKYVVLYEVDNVEVTSVTFGQVIKSDKKSDLFNFLSRYPQYFEDVQTQFEEKNSTTINRLLKFFFGFEDYELADESFYDFFKNNYWHKEMYKTPLITYCISNVNGLETDFRVTYTLMQHGGLKCCQGIRRPPKIGYTGMATGMELNELFDWDFTNLSWGRTFNGNSYENFISNNYFENLKKVDCDSNGHCCTP